MILLSAVTAGGQPYLSYKTLSATGDRALLMQAVPDTSGHLVFGGTVSGIITLGGQVLADTAGMGIFTGRTDSAGTVSFLQVTAFCEGLCDLQQMLVLPGGDVVLFITFRKSLLAGDTLFRTRGWPALVMITVDASGQVVERRLLLRKFMGRVRTAVWDSTGRIGLGGWFRKMEADGTVYRARGRKDAFFLQVTAAGRCRVFVAGGAGEQEIARLLPAGRDTLVVAGIFSQELAAGGSLLRCETGKALFLAGCDSAGIRQPLPVAQARDLKIGGAALGRDSLLLLGGSFSGTLVTKDTAVQSAGYEDGFLLFSGKKGMRLTTLAGKQPVRVEAVTAGPRGRFFLNGTCKETVILEGDTVAPAGRDPSPFLAEAGSDGRILWVRQPQERAGKSLSFLAVTHDLLLWTGGNENGATPWLASWLDPCTLLHFDLPDEHFLCKGAVDTLVAAPGYVSYLWNPGNITGPVLEISDTGYYKARITDKYGCVAEDSVYVAGDSVRLHFTVEDEVLPEGFNGRIDLAVTSGQPPFTYLWSTGDISEDLDGLQAGTYGVMVTDSAGCSAMAEAEVQAKETTGIYDLYNYPNPFADVTRILYSLPEGARVEISIWDVAGKKLFVLKEQNVEQGVHSFEWARHQLKDGVYYLKMRSPLGEVTKKIMIISR